jgi:putative sterol carrier protein
MASVEECEQALQRLAGRLQRADGATKGRIETRSVACRLTDLSVAFAGTLRDGGLHDIARAAESPNAQITLTMTSDDLLALSDGSLSLSSAWAGGRVRIDAGILDLIRLRSYF